MRAVVLLVLIVALGSCGRGSRDAAPDLPGQALCGDPAIYGEIVPPVEGAGACGIANPVKVTMVSGVTLSRPALMECSTATALRRWVDSVAKPAVGRRGGGLSELRVAAHYVCRTRNHRPGAKISEHGKGRAIDISAVTLADGEVITVQDHWRTLRRGRILKRMHAGACGPFGTVLGPGSDGYHEDHFHFDTASYRSGPYCK